MAIGTAITQLNCLHKGELPGQKWIDIKRTNCVLFSIKCKDAVWKKAVNFVIVFCFRQRIPEGDNIATFLHTTITLYPL